MDLAPGSTLKLGHRGGSFLDGAIDEIQLCVGRALTDDEIADLLVADAAGTCPGG